MIKASGKGTVRNRHPYLGKLRCVDKDIGLAPVLKRGGDLYPLDKSQPTA